MEAFNPDETHRELEANGAMERPCSVCGKIDWRMGALPSAMLVMSDEFTVDFSDERASRLVSVVCMGCGYVRFHDPSVLRRQCLP